MAVPLHKSGYSICAVHNQIFDGVERQAFARNARFGLALGLRYLAKAA